MSVKHLPVIKPREVAAVLKRLGFYAVRQEGSHVQLKRGNLCVTVPMHSGDLARGTLRSILRQAHLTVEEFNRAR